MSYDAGLFDGPGIFTGPGLFSGPGILDGPGVFGPKTNYTLFQDADGNFVVDSDGHYIGEDYHAS